jgi:hypothetical protein
MALKEAALELTQGDSEDYLVTVHNDAVTPLVGLDLSTAVDGTANRPAIVRFAVKKNPSSESNADAAVFKSSYYADQISFLPQLGATLGQCRALLDKPDTKDVPAGAYRWDVEVTRQDVLRFGASTGTLTTVAGSARVVGVGTFFTRAKVGDVVQILAGPDVLRPVKIVAISSDTLLEIEAPVFSSAAGSAFEIRRGKHKTAARGPFTLLQSVVME